MLKHKLNYHHDSARLFSPIAHLPWSMMLDSGQAINPATGKAGSQYGRYDILVAEPFITLVTQANRTVITQNGLIEYSEEDPFLLLKNMLAPYQAPKVGVLFADSTSPIAGTSLPFAGGALGYFAYDLARRLEKLPDQAQPAAEIPDMMVGIYDWAVVVDHREQCSHLISHGFNVKTHQNWPRLQALFDAAFRVPLNDVNLSQFQVNSAVSSNLPEPQYKKAFSKIKSYITEGDCYQVNLAQRFSAQVSGDSWVMYQKLREISPAPFMAYMQLPLNTNVNFWGSQWEKNNIPSGGASNASFKGFAITPAVPTVGATFTSAPGNSAPPPAGVPQYIGIIVTSKVTKSGSNITGTIVKLVVVKVDAGYQGNPGHAGTGTIVAFIQ